MYCNDICRSEINKKISWPYDVFRKLALVNNHNELKLSKTEYTEKFLALGDWGQQ